MLEFFIIFWVGREFLLTHNADIFGGHRLPSFSWMLDDKALALGDILGTGRWLIIAAKKSLKLIG